MKLHDCRNILIFGGSFDPPQRAHLELPLHAARAIGADALLYVPAGIPPHKAESVAPAMHRLVMLELALKEAALPLHTDIWCDELERAAAGEPTYTVVTLERLRKQVGVQPTLRLLIGTDQLRAFDTWHQPQRVIELAEPVVMVRPPDTRESALSHLPTGYDAQQWAQRMVDVPQLDISSTDIRERLAQGSSVAGLVPPTVEQYIHDHGLYGAKARS